MNKKYLEMTILELFDKHYHATINNDQQTINEIANTIAGAICFKTNKDFDEIRQAFGYKEIEKIRKK